MKKKIHILSFVPLFCLLGYFVQAQADTDPVFETEEFLQDLIDDSNLEGEIGDQFVLRSSRNIGSQRVIVYDQVLDGYIVENQFVAFLLNEEGKVQFTHETVRPLEISSAPRIRIGQRKLSRIVQSQFRGEASIAKQELIIVNGEKDILAYKLLVKTENPGNYYSVYVNAFSGSVYAHENLTENTGKSMGDEAKIIKAIGDQCGCGPTGFQNVCLFNPDPTTTSVSSAHIANNTQGGSIHTLANSADLAEYFPLSVPSAFSHNSNKFCCNGLGQGAPDYRITFCHFHLNEYLFNMTSCISGIGVVQYNVSSNIGSTAFYNGSSIEYGSNSGNPMAEDLFHVIHGANQYLMDILNSGLSGSVKAGTMDYLAMVHKNGGTWTVPDPNECWAHAGPATSRRTDVAYSSSNGCGYSSGDDNIDGQYWSTVLTDIEGVISQALVKELALTTIQMVSSTDFQEKAAQIFYDAAKAHPSINDALLCDIYVVLENQYGTCFTDLVDSETDYFIHDDINDIGDEPNTQTSQFWISPDIWNCVSGPNCGSHEQPEHGQPNYLRVRVTGNGCIPFEGAVVHGYWSAASSGHTWSEDWLASTSNGLGAEVNNTETVPPLQEGQQYITSMEWMPPDPMAINPGSQNNSAHVCILARIVSPLDPMYDEQDPGGIGGNNKRNNNNAMKNMTIFDVQPNAPMQKPALIIIRNIFEEETTFNIELVGVDVALNEMEEGLIEFELTEPTYEAWRNGGAKGEGFKQIRGNQFIVTGRQMTFYNLRLKPKFNYGINVGFTLREGVRQVREFQFDLVQKTTRGEVIGGNRFYVKNGRERPRKESKNLGEINEITVFPNPVEEMLHVQLNQSNTDIETIQIYDSLGALKYVSNKTEFNEVENVDVSDFQIGLYYMSLVKSDGTKETMKFFKN